MPTARPTIESAYATSRCRRSPRVALQQRRSRPSRRRARRRATTSEPTIISVASALPRRKRPVRPPVDDVERALEHAEERERRPEQERAADDPERGRVLLDRRDDRARIESIDVRRERPLQLPDEELDSSAGLVHEPEQREREEEQRHEREQREVGDHRGQVRAAVGEELRERLRQRATHGCSMRRSVRMDAAQALADLTEISSQVEAASSSSTRRRGAGLDARRRGARRAARRAASACSRRRRRAARREAAARAARGGDARGQRLRRPRRRPR